MSEREKAVLNNQTDSQSEGEAEAVAMPAAARRPRLALVLSLVALLAVAGGLFMGYRYWSGMKLSLERLNQSLVQTSQDQAVMRERLAATTRALQQQQEKLVIQERLMSEQRQQWAQTREQLQHQETNINRSLSQVQQRLGGNVGLWQVAEAEYLMRLANLRLTLMGDPRTAQTALTAADERLQATADPGWEGTRKLLAQEIAALEAVPKVDRDGLNARLSALLEQVDQLPLQEEGVRLQVAGKGTPTEEQETSTAGFDLSKVMQDLWEGFKSMMVIRHHDKPIAAMLPPEQRYFLVQNLQLKLEGAKLALLGRDEVVFRDSLSSAAQWVERYFAAAPEVDVFLAQLKALSDEQIAPPLPDISASIRALQAYRGHSIQGDAE